MTSTTIRLSRNLSWWLARAPIAAGLMGTNAQAQPAPAAAAGPSCNAAVPKQASPASPGALGIGDRAPTLAPAAWVNGAAVPAFRPGTVYLVEFWATWCLPCRQTIPHLNQLQRDHDPSRLQVVGVAPHEGGSVADLATFVARNHIDYPVAYVADDTAPWGWRARPAGLPLVFVVDRKGRIAWWGEPRGDGFAGAVEKALRS